MRMVRESEQYWAVIHFELELVLEVIGPFIAEGGATWFAEHCATGAPEGHRWHVMELKNPDSK